MTMAQRKKQIRKLKMMLRTKIILWIKKVAIIQSRQRWQDIQKPNIMKEIVNIIRRKKLIKSKR
jgi:hypothetical protein